MLKHITDTAYEMNAFIPNTLSNVNLIAAARSPLTRQTALNHPPEQRFPDHA